MNIKSYLDKFIKRSNDIGYLDHENDIGYLDYYSTWSDLTSKPEKTEVEIKNDLRKKKLESL